MNKMRKSKINNFEDLLISKYGNRGDSRREEWEQEFEAFKLGILIEEARKQRKMTQEELALKYGTNKGYISRIENDASDIRLSTLMKIVNEVLGGKLKLSLEL
jgi:HTH-type transcriptional regulator / antitoxin HipB